MTTLLLLLCDILANRIQSGSTGVPVLQLGGAEFGDTLRGRDLGKKGALLGFMLEDEEGNPVEGDLGLHLASDARSSENLVLIVQLAIAAGRPGLSAGEILESIARQLMKQEIWIDKSCSALLELTKTEHLESAPGVDYFTARYTLALVKTEAKKPA